eukprot:8702764-Pyramimonas_sp.AAC.1
MASPAALCRCHWGLSSRRCPGSCPLGGRTAARRGSTSSSAPCSDIVILHNLSRRNTDVGAAAAAGRTA